MEVKYVDNVLLKKELFNLYSSLIECNGWNLCRSSLGGDFRTFPGFIIKNNYNEIGNHYWNGYFTSLYERISIKFYEKYNYELPKDIKRIHLGAKNEISMTEFHTDTEESECISIVGFLTPVWSQDWGGALQVEENKINFEPGKFVIFNNNQIHEGVGPSKAVPYWRISINYVIKKYNG